MVEEVNYCTTVFGRNRAYYCGMVGYSSRTIERVDSQVIACARSGGIDISTY